MDARPPPPTSAATAPSSAASCANTAADSAATTGDTDAATLPLNLRTIWLTSATAAAISFASDARRRCGSAGCSAPSTSRANVSTIRCKRVTVFARTSPLEPRGPREARQSWIAAVNASRVPTCASDEKPFDTAAMTAMRCAASIALCSSASTALPSCRQSDGAAAAAAAEAAPRAPGRRAAARGQGRRGSPSFRARGGARARGSRSAASPLRCRRAGRRGRGRAG
mmetsp:Transcript_31329/g.98168  ORF Transcript_31329/g.98168 Transcript_31329/m.98168 type:complete len:226 (+) Transcript_31329:651-1328(+)